MNAKNLLRYHERLIRLGLVMPLDGKDSLKTTLNGAKVLIRCFEEEEEKLEYPIR